MAIKTFSVRLISAHMEAPGVRHLAFERVDKEILDFIPGQFISVHFMHQDKSIKRSYSIASIPGQSQQIELALAYVSGGAASAFLFNLDPGQEITMSGPYGRLILRDEDRPKRLILIATGTGVTPYRSMLPMISERLQKDLNLTIYVLLGVRTPEEQLYTADFLSFKEHHPRFDFRIYYSRTYPGQPAPHEYTGYVQTAFPEFQLDPNTDLIYLCGNPNMVDSAVDLLKEKQFTIQQIRREKYIS
jgi:ferredoxin-NADP reductase